MNREYYQKLVEEILKSQATSTAFNPYPEYDPVDSPPIFKTNLTQEELDKVWERLFGTRSGRQSASEARSSYNGWQKTQNFGGQTTSHAASKERGEYFCLHTRTVKRWSEKELALPTLLVFVSITKCAESSPTTQKRDSSSQSIVQTSGGY